jgi:hypothetical protein
MIRQRTQKKSICEPVIVGADDRPILVRQSSVRDRIVRIGFDRFLQMFHCTLQTVSEIGK